MSRLTIPSPIAPADGAAALHLVVCDDCGTSIGVRCASDLPAHWSSRLIGPTQQVQHFCPTCDVPHHWAVHAAVAARTGG